MVIGGSDGYVQPTDGVVLRRFLQRARLSRREAAGRLEIDEAKLRDYCTRSHVPRYVMLAVESLAREEFEYHFLGNVYSTVSPAPSRVQRKSKKRRDIQRRMTFRGGARVKRTRHQVAER